MKQRFKILLIDDEVDFHNRIKAGVLDNTFDIEYVISITQSLEFIYKNKYDLILLDLTLGEEKNEGVSLLPSLVEKNIPIIIVSNNRDVNVTFETAKRGADGYLDKNNYNALNWISQINNVIRNHKKPDSYSITTETKKILSYLSASPSDLDDSQEYTSIESEINGGKFRENFDIKLKLKMTKKDFSRSLLSHSSNIIHISTHGDRDGNIYFQRRNDEDTMRCQGFCDMIVANITGVECIVLSICHSKRHLDILKNKIEERNENQAELQPICIIGVNGTIKDRAANIFAETFYQSLSEGTSYQKAFEIGKAQLRGSNYYNQEAPKLCFVKV